MPATTRQKPPKSTVPQPQLNGILGSGVSASSLNLSKITAAVYGRNGVGETTLACQGGEPTALISIEPAPTGGARSVANMPNVTVYQVAARYLQGPDGRMETIKGSDKAVAIAYALRQQFQAGTCPFSKVVIDGVTSWNDIILNEIMGIDWETMPAILGLGKVSADQYIERSERLIRYLRPYVDLPCDLWIIGQEHDHNAPKDKTTTKSGKEFSRPSQTPFMREAHPMAQEGSFFSLKVSDTQAKWIQDASDFVMQLYEDNEVKEVKVPDTVINGQVIPGPTELVPTGRRVRRMRCRYHPNYAARFHCADYRNVPEYIEAPTPEDLYQAFLDVAAGNRTQWGKYS